MEIRPYRQPYLDVRLRSYGTRCNEKWCGTTAMRGSWLRTKATSMILPLKRFGGQVSTAGAGPTAFVITVEPLCCSRSARRIHEHP
jgi:hypothetical protein